MLLQVIVSGGPGKLTDNGANGSRVNPDAIRAHLAELIASASLRSSRRSQEFLEYTVAHTIAGNLNMLKERAIGEHVFGRLPDYDTGQDSIVRVKANEVRRRLAQYYDLHPSTPLRFEIASGSYVVRFHETPPAPVTTPQPVAPAPVVVASPSKRRWLWWTLATVIPLTAAAAMLFLVQTPDTSLFAKFWRPISAGTRGSLLCIPTPETYRIYGNGKQHLINAFRPRPPGGQRSLPDSKALQDVTILPEPNLMVGLGDARALTLLYAFAASQGKAPLMRVGAETTFTELRSGPAIVIGGLTNIWSLDLMKDMRFTFSRQDTTPGILDTTSNQFLCLKQNIWEPRRTTDCAVITRLTRSKTGHPVIIAAGLDHYGTLAVGEFLTRPELLEPALRVSPARWEDRNLQIVFEIEVVRDDVGPPKVLAAHVW